MSRIVSGAGFRMSDNRASGGGLEENDVLTCPHCQAVMNYQQWKHAENGAHGWCPKCAKPCCASGPCAEAFAKNGCIPFLKQIEKIISDNYRMEQFRKLAGLDPGPPASLKRSGLG